MDPQASSFIPKKPLGEARATRAGGSSIILLISILIFIASIVAAGAVFAYKQILSSTLASESDSLAKAKEACVLDVMVRTLLPVMWHREVMQ